jgi:transcription elongation GreA/GreB family factor
MGLFDKFVAVFSRGNDPNAFKLKRLRQIGRDLRQNKYAKFYKPKTGELCAPLAKFLYDLYRVVAPAQLVLQEAAKSEELKNVCVTTFLDDNLKALGERLTSAAIRERAGKEQAGKELAESIKKDMALYASGFNALLVTNADMCYSAIMALLRFVAFDFFFLLKKFDSNISERNFSYQPKFQPISGVMLVEELKDFMEAAALVEAEKDWKPSLAVLNLYKGGIDAVNPDQWAKMMRLLRDVNASGILELVVQHISKDPVWQSVVKPFKEKVAAAYLEAKKAEVEDALRKIQDDKRNAQIGQIAAAVFGSAKVDRMVNYTEKAGEVFIKKGFDGFTKVAVMNYLRAFLIDFFKSEMRELCDLFLVRGKWTDPELSLRMSESFHAVMDITEKTLIFDKALSDAGEHGGRLKQALQKSDRDKGQAKYVRIILNTVNNDAQRLVNAAAANLVTIGKNLKTLLEDHRQVPSVLVSNWNELEAAAGTSLNARVTADLKKMHHFIQLLQFFAAPVTGE